MKKIILRSSFILLFIFFSMNIVAYFHASKFTHFDRSSPPKTKSAKELSLGEKIKTLLLGVNNPRPSNKKYPSRRFTTIRLKANKEIGCWDIRVQNPKGTVVIFHGYSGSKSTMLDKADLFHKLGYNTLLVDFMGSGSSEGDQTTIGFMEAEQVKASFDHLVKQKEKNIILFGTSMGAAAIMKAMNDHDLSAQALILECPFGTMLETVKARFETMHAPTFPMANLLVYWGGKQNDFDAFSHNPTDYAKKINCPTLLMYGLKDQEVSAKEIWSIFEHMKGPKTLATYPLAGHENYLKKYKTKWTEDISHFLDQTLTLN